MDHATFFFLNQFAGRSMLTDRAIIFFASYFPYVLAALFLVYVFYSQYPKREKWILLAEAATSVVVARLGVVEMIRFFHHRLRPLAALSIHPLISENGNSFPSGHAAFFFALSTALYFYNKRWGIAFFIASAVIGLARVMAGVHYPSDIVGGAVVGIATGYGVFRVSIFLRKRYNINRI